MALRDQPYLPLYIKDYLTDEKLSMCSWSTQGVYIKLLCLLHKSDPYGTILLKQNDKQDTDFALSFAIKIAKLLPIEIDTLSAALEELIREGCLIIQEDKLFQKRMVRDNEISIERSKSGRKGGKKTQQFAKAKRQAKVEANTAYANANEIGIKNNIKEREIEFRQNVYEQDPLKYSQDMIEKFCQYWTEPNRSGTKMRFELEKVFDIPRRLATWASRDKDIKTKYGSTQSNYSRQPKNVNDGWQ